MDNLYYVQHVDKNVGPADYKHLKADELLIMSKFRTIQGEGVFAGHPCTFLRVAGCNRGHKTTMGCNFCDTEFDYDKGVVHTIEELVSFVRFGPKLVVLTGGEPMLQANIVPLITELNKIGKTVQIESNGDRLANGYEKDSAVLVVSPKIKHSSQIYLKLKDNVWNAVNYLKFIIDDRGPYAYLPVWAFEWADEKGRDKVYISPIAVYKRPVKEGEVASFWTDDLIDKKLTATNYAYAAKLCQIYKFTLSVQSHLLINLP